MLSATLLAGVCAGGVMAARAEVPDSLRAAASAPAERALPGATTAVAVDEARSAVVAAEPTPAGAPHAEPAATVAGPAAQPVAEPVSAPSVAAPSVADVTADEPAGDAAAADVALATVDRSATTGVASGATLTPMAGGTVSATGVVANRVITGDVVFTGSGLTVRNVRVTGHAVFRGDDLVIEDSEFGSWALSGTERVRAARVEVFGNPGQDGLHVTSDTGPVRDVVVADSWIHNPLVANGSHYDGIQVRGVDGLAVQNVVIDLGAYATGQNASVFLEDANGGNRNVLVQGSWLLGGGYTVVSYGTNVRVTDTVVRAGRWGYLNPDSWTLAAFNGNVADGGGPLTYDGRIVTVSAGPPIVDCWSIPGPALDGVTGATQPPTS